MKTPAPQTLQSLGEDAFLRGLLPTLPTAPTVLVGPGDDCAVLHLPGSPDDLLLTHDPLIAGRHFLPSAPAALVGRKAVSRAISDIAAMGGRPRWLAIGLTAPKTTPAARIRAIYRAIARTAAARGIAVVGGDTAEAADLAFHLTAIGTAPHGTAVRRSGARPGHRLFVTGRLGRAWRDGSTRHFTFSPRLPEGAFLASRRYASAMMDLSDGLATDLPRLAAASRVGCRLSAAAIPLAPRATLADALFDGEDYELLFAVPPSKVPALLREWPRTFPPLAEIGCFTPPENGLRLLRPDGTAIPLPRARPHHFA